MGARKRMIKWFGAIAILAVFYAVSTECRATDKNILILPNPNGAGFIKIPLTNSPLPLLGTAPAKVFTDEIATSCKCQLKTVSGLGLDPAWITLVKGVSGVTW